MFETTLQNQDWQYGSKIAIKSKVAPLLRDDLFSDGEFAVIMNSKIKNIRIGDLLVKTSQNKYKVDKVLSF